MIFDQFPRILPLFATNLLLTVLTVIGFLLLIIPGIYLAIAYQLAVVLVAEKKLGPWQALEASRKAIGKHWWKALGLGIALGLVNLLGILALGIGLLWTVPMTFIALGVFYRSVFGVEPEIAGEGTALG